eukprot:CAMPEP_0183293082 /NCGR_PEP_ID=MMETSP0160_2-20130417/1909_1 /TAXON_ID=2839 ORGANISM="Odontella Sinensis, Strain Grunow 1884" /NCGR_SAMPLE_ID=MMETSP0160_2 /ASSEMBLY_ACC=CAM_ASM_000250 /LENGTH=255 /DNA_ID=CAMNT_0025454141 /DNA_START=34 /DNA_END=801 /DNA_ORIENTATION=-
MTAAATPTSNTVIVLVRHGESLAQEAHRNGVDRSDPSLADCHLSDLGVEQALRSLPADVSNLRLGATSTLLFISPPSRAAATAALGLGELIARGGGGGSRSGGSGGVPFVIHPDPTEFGMRDTPVPENEPRPPEDRREGPRVVDSGVSAPRRPPWTFGRFASERSGRRCGRLCRVAEPSAGGAHRGRPSSQCHKARAAPGPRGPRRELRADGVARGGESGDLVPMSSSKGGSCDVLPEDVKNPAPNNAPVGKIMA